MTHVETWRDTYHVRSYETDPRARASVRAVCNYLQETAGNHAQALNLSVEQMVDENLSWFLARLHVEMDDYPSWREAVTVETWPSGQNGLLAMREFLIYGEGDRPLGRATSAWMLVDLGRRRPVRLPEHIRELRLPDHEPPLPHSTETLPLPESVDAEETFPVRYGDLDLNQHVNHVRYIAWALETLPYEAVEGYAMRSLEVQFRTEARLGDTVHARVARHDDGETRTFHHVLRLDDSDREVTRQRTVWTPLQGS